MLQSFDPVPSVERITTNIARKASLLERKRHEQQLRALQLSTAARYVHLRPPAALAARMRQAYPQNTHT